MQKSMFPRWMGLILAIAGAYNILWGAAAVLWPGIFFHWTGMVQPNYPELWQCIGMMVGVYGVGYWIASTDPIRHWPIILVGLLGKIFGPLGMAKGYYEGRFSGKFLWISLANDVIWWVPFALILVFTYRQKEQRVRAASPDIQGWAMRAKSQFGVSILEHSRIRPVLLVFLRHVGCTFCRETLADLRDRRDQIEASGTQIVLVHMGKEDVAEEMLAKYGLADVPRVWDPKLGIYRAFGLEKGEFTQLLGPKVLVRGFQAGILNKHGIGAAQGDVTQMPGAFLVFHGEILKSYRHQTAADRPDYIDLVSTTPDV